jgi:Fic family protein
MNREKVIAFITESNGIEGIFRRPNASEIRAHEDLWMKDYLRIEDIQEFVSTVANAPLRTQDHHSVVVGNHVPPQGGPLVVKYLTDWLDGIQDAVNGVLDNPYDAHAEYERIHPFMDGNGRSGRALWAWQMMRLGNDPFVLPFLQLWYYATLDRHHG